MIGAILDGYEVLEKVGEGAMAVVYLARNEAGQEVAVKVLHPHLVTNERTRTRFKREAQAIASLQSPHIPGIHAFVGEAAPGKGAPGVYLITDFVRGHTIDELMERAGRLPCETAILLSIQVCRALEPAHAQGIVHRDIKPANIMVDDQGTVKLMDFGVARILDEATLTLTGALVGSPAYMSPEQTRNDSVDHRSDLFSLGSLLFLTVTGRLPFEGSNPAALLGAIIDGDHLDPADLLPEIHPGLTQVIDRCLEVSTADRYQSAAELEDALATLLVDSGIDAAAPGHWSLSSYLADPEEYGRKLTEHVVNAHVHRGRELLGNQRPALALGLLNRVLTLDADNPDALALVTGNDPE